MTTEQLERANEVYEKLEMICKVIYLDEDKKPVLKTSATEYHINDVVRKLIKDEFVRLVYATYKELESEFEKL